MTTTFNCNKTSILITNNLFINYYNQDYLIINVHLST